MLVLVLATFLAMPTNARISLDGTVRCEFDAANGTVKFHLEVDGKKHRVSFENRSTAKLLLALDGRKALVYGTYDPSKVYLVLDQVIEVLPPPKDDEKQSKLPPI